MRCVATWRDDANLKHKIAMLFRYTHVKRARCKFGNLYQRLLNYRASMVYLLYGCRSVR